MYMKQKTKTGLCQFLECNYGFIRETRDIFVLSYSKQGFISSFAVRLGAHKLCFSWMSDNTGYEVNKDLTYRHNDI